MKKNYFLFFWLHLTEAFNENFNENLTAVHYSIVSPGIETEIKPGISVYAYLKLKTLATSSNVNLD